MSMRVTEIGYLEIVSGILFADIEYYIFCIDVDKNNIERHKKRGVRNPFYGPG